MRILFVADERAIHMRHWATALQRRGHEVGYVAFGEQPWMRELSFSRRLRSPFRGYPRYVLAVKQVKKALHEFGPDVVHSYYLTNYAFLAARAVDRPLVVTVAGSDLFVDSRSALFRLVNGYVLKRASVVHLVAHHMVQPAVGLGAERSKVHVIHEGVDLQAFPPFADDVGQRPPHVICTRQFRPVHDVGTAVAAMVELLGGSFELPAQSRFIFLGDGPERPKLETLARRKAGERVKFLGEVSWEHVSEELRKASVYVSPSRSDGASVSLLQALVSGAFPVVTDIPANREWIQDGVNGFLFTPGDFLELARKVAVAIQDVPLRVRAAELNKNMILEKATDELMLRKVEDMYSDAVSP